MRTPLVAGNWKMNLQYAEAMTLVDAIVDGLPENNGAEIVLAPPTIYLHDVLDRIQRKPGIALSAQDVSAYERGAFTGEVAASMLASVGVEYVIVGHSERREYHHEDHPLLAAKVDRVLEQSLLPIFCCGEKLDDRTAGRHFELIEPQLHESLFHLSPEKVTECVIAYEPVWAIGTGVVATTGQAQEMHRFIRQLLFARYGEPIASEMRILYGGSVNATNASDLFTCPDVDGGLVGGASLKAVDFLSIIAAAGTNR
ncbi:MAG TPA: triose-phosphate isomerase [Bacteroidia bacterium]|nr:triose-phosphate isomerase [Bacteroidia bacterium]